MCIHIHINTSHIYVCVSVCAIQYNKLKNLWIMTAMSCGRIDHAFTEGAHQFFVS